MKRSAELYNTKMNFMRGFYEIAKVKNPSPKPQPIYLKVFLNFRPISASFSPQIFIATRVAIMQKIFVITLSAIIVWSVRINKNSMYFTIVVTRIVIMRKISFFYFVI